MITIWLPSRGAYITEPPRKLHVGNSYSIVTVLSVSISRFVSVHICPSVHVRQFFCMSTSVNSCPWHICPFTRLSVCLYVYMFVCLSDCLSVRLPACLVYMCLPANLSVCLNVCMSARLSVHAFVHLFCSFVRRSVLQCVWSSTCLSLGGQFVKLIRPWGLLTLK